MISGRQGSLARKSESLSRRIAWCGVLVAIALFSSGCSPRSIGEVSDRGPTEDVKKTSNPDAFVGPWAFVEDEILFLTLPGSSSCPPVPVELDGTDPDTLIVTVKRTSWPMCTSDLRTVTYELKQTGSQYALQVLDGERITSISIVHVDEL